MRIVGLFIIFFALVAPVHAQPPIPPTLTELGPSPTELPHGTEIIGSYAEQMSVPTDADSADLVVSVLEREWVVPGGGTIRWGCIRCPELRLAPTVINTYRGRVKTKLFQTDIPILGERTLSERVDGGAILMWSSGRYVSLVAVDGKIPESRSLAGGLASSIQARIDQLGERPVAPFVATVEPLATVVNQVAGVRAVFKLSFETDPQFLPCNGGFRVTGPSPDGTDIVDVFELDVASHTSPLELTWDGRTSDGGVAPPGIYGVTAGVADLAGRAETQFFQVTVADSPDSSAFPAAKDSVLRANKPHQNEGANPSLVLDKHNKETPVVAFDLAGVDLTRLTRATLYLTTRDYQGSGNSQSNKGGQVVVSRLPHAWSEGSGSNLRTDGDPGSEGQTSGTGAGVTWFSPIDADISNKRPDSDLAWNGASGASAPSAPVFVPDGYLGDVAFDVTQDLLDGADNGWVIRMQGSGHKDVVFYSREGAPSPEATPRLVLEFGGSLASRQAEAGSGFLRPLRALGSQSEEVAFRPWKRFLAEELLALMLRPVPLAEPAARTLLILSALT